MSNLRFFTAREVFDAFPGAAGDIASTPQDDTEAPLDFLSRLLKGRTPEDAVSFCAYLLGRREAVWWACACHRLFGPPTDREDEKALLIAEAWVREPEEHRRRAALALGLGGNHQLAGTWLSLAAGGAGGTFILDGKPGPPIPADMTAKAVRSAVLISLARLPIRERASRLPACVDICRRLAQGQAQTS
jgi:hypothetical protein